MSMERKANELVLTSPLDPWVLTLRDGNEVTVWAHGVTERDGYHVFVALMRGEPHFEMEVCRVPMAIVAEFVGG